MGNVYRVILESSPGHVQTGATYPGCDPVNSPALCQPVDFTTVGAAVDYATAHGETPVQVYSVQEAIDFWSAHEAESGPVVWDASWLWWIAGGAALLFLWPRHKKAAGAR